MQLFFEKNTLREQLDALLLSVYAPDDADDDILNGYCESKWVRIATILGLPTRYLGDKYKPLSHLSLALVIKNIAQNFFGWDSRYHPLFLFIRMLWTTSYQTLSTPLRLLLNVLKIGSELIPGLLLIAAWFSFKWFYQKLTRGIQGRMYSDEGILEQIWNSKMMQLIKSLLALPLALALIGTVLGTLSLFFIGHCLTSPMQSLNEAWQLGKKTSLFRGLLYVIGVMTVISLLYMVAFPLGVKVLTLTILPLLPKILPPALFHIYQWGAQYLAPIFTRFGYLVLDIAHRTVLPLIQSIFGYSVAQFFGAIITAMPAAVGGGVIFGALMGVFPGMYRVGSMLLQSMGQGVVYLFQRMQRYVNSVTHVDTSAEDAQRLVSDVDHDHDRTNDSSVVITQGLLDISSVRRTSLGLSTKSDDVATFLEPACRLPEVRLENMGEQPPLESDVESVCSADYYSLNSADYNADQSGVLLDDTNSESEYVLADDSIRQLGAS